MQLSDFDFTLPNELIARFPVEKRASSRLLHLDTNGDLADLIFSDLVEKINPGDLLIFNNTKVLQARLKAFKPTGAKLEILIERILSPNTALAKIKGAKSLKQGSEIIVGEDKLGAGKGFKAIMTERKGEFCNLQFCENKTILEWLEIAGHLPLPPYLERGEQEIDNNRYQTVYGTELGAVAAPTAGLHFDDLLLQKLKNKGIKTAFITLHTASGTFAPVRVENITEHQMHSEIAFLSKEVADLIIQTKKQGKRVIAVGTTSVRTIETAAKQTAELIAPFSGETNIFIYPGKKFKVVDALVTNFHLPKSTLLMLVCAFAGSENIFKAYQHAIEQKYRFFSYGDAMFIEK